jgi:hypothetical protein
MTVSGEMFMKRGRTDDSNDYMYILHTHIYIYIHPHDLWIRKPLFVLVGNQEIIGWRE